MARISTSSSGGIVNIQDTNGNPITSTGGALNVNAVSNAGTPLLIYNEITGIAASSSAPVATYTVPAGKTLSLSGVQASSDSISTVVVDIDGDTAMKGRIYYTDFNLSLNFPNGHSLPEGTVITINATNNSLQGSAAFNATIQGTLS